MRRHPLWPSLLSLLLLTAAAACTCERTPAVRDDPEGVPASNQAATPSPAQEKLDGHADGWFGMRDGARSYVSTDRPLYKPGETIWFRLHRVGERQLGASAQGRVTAELVDPSGAVVQSHRGASNTERPFGGAFDLAEELAGGEYTLRISGQGEPEEKKLVVSTYEPPRIKKTLEFLRKAYGAGDLVSAAVQLEWASGGPLADRPIVGVLTLDGQRLPPVTVRTNAQGAAVVSVQLPAQLDKGDATLTVQVEDAGVTEAISRRVPIILRKLKLALYPEGGDLVAGLSSRVYFAAQDLLDKPADVEGRVVDDAGLEVTRFTSLHDGLGRFELRPATGRRYHVEITRPAGVDEHFDLPGAKEDGCVLRTFDDPRGKEPAIRLRAECSDKRDVVVTAVIRGERVASASATAARGKPAIVHLQHPRRQGVARVTLFDGELKPLAERLVWRGLDDGLRVKLTADRESYTPRGEVVLTVEATDAAGQPVRADLALSAVDDTVLSYADDTTGHLLARTLLEVEVPGKVEEPNFYFKDDAKAAVALELLLGTRGWRRFEWGPVLAPPPPPPPKSTAMKGGRGGNFDEGMDFAPPPLAMMPAAEPMPMPGRAEQAARPRPAAPPPARPRGEPVLMERRRELIQVIRGNAEAMAGEKVEVDGLFGRDERKKRRSAFDDEYHQPTRVFAVPAPEPDYDGPRHDFRETVFWAPSVRTGEDGKATVRFTLSDAVTGFRVRAEGFGGGAAGRGEALVASKLPFHLDPRLPLAVSQGDRVDLPVTFRNATAGPLEVSFAHRFGEGLTQVGTAPPELLRLAANEGRTVEVPVSVTTARGGKLDVMLRARGQGLTDEIHRTLLVSPLGFPQTVSLSGKVEKDTAHKVNLKGALPGTATAKVTFYPSPLATMLAGLDGILREPYGCFEQASSSTYPNVLVASYLQRGQVPQVEVLARAANFIDRGYKKLAPYETKTRGFEWFGGSPGHEALTAYGLMEFHDMKEVYPDVDEVMLRRSREWLLSRRDGQGGFLRNDRALDTFGRASPEVTDAYVVWALTEAGTPVAELKKELERVRKLGETSTDAYVVALAAKSLRNAAPEGEAAKLLAKRLAGMQKPDGSFVGTTHSVTMSGGQSLAVETSSVAVMALAGLTEHEGATRKAVQWLAGARDGHGGFGSTQATVLALKALLAYDRHAPGRPGAGEVWVEVNGTIVARTQLVAGREEPLVLEGWEGALLPGQNLVRLGFSGTGELPYAVAVDFTSDDPPDSPEAPVTLTTALAAEKTSMGETLRLTATVRNVGGRGLPMTLARVGIPGGATFQTWQLEELVKKGLVDFYETGPREVVLYFRQLEPEAKKEIPIELMAQVPGKYTAPASSAYLYYTAEHRSWAKGLPLEIGRRSELQDQ